MQPESPEEVLLGPAPPRAHAPDQPFWNYADLAIFIGLAFAFTILLCTPLVLVFRPHIGQPSFVVLALVVQMALYASIYLALLVIFRTRYHRPVFQSLGWRPVPFNIGWCVLWG